MGVTYTKEYAIGVTDEGEVKLFETTNGNHKLFCFGENLVSLDVSKCLTLKFLRCHQNKLTSLDLSNNVNLEILEVDSNNLQVLDISHNKELYSIHAYRNRINEINIGAITDLRFIFLDAQVNIKGINLGGEANIHFVR